MASVEARRVREAQSTKYVVSVVIGNPKARSRTRDAAERLAHELTGSAPLHIIELSGLGADLLNYRSPYVEAAVDTVRSSDIVIVASPTYKATYTGLLKLFLEQFASGEGLRGVVAVPLMLGAGPDHALAPELLLKPLIVELGAIVPSPGLYLLDSTYRTDGRLEDYLARWGTTLRALAQQQEVAP